jgi:hypothetical protein
VPTELALFPGVPIDPPLAGSITPLCNMKQVTVNQGQNAAADFHYKTDVPKAARAVGFTNNDLAAEFNQASPIFGEKLAAAWIPVAFKDWTGREITRVYTDEFGSYNALLPSTFSINVPSPTGVSPSMITLILNDPTLPDGSPDPFYNPTFAVTPWTFNYMPGATTYLDTPTVPIRAFSAGGTGFSTAPANILPVASRRVPCRPTSSDLARPDPGHRSGDRHQRHPRLRFRRDARHRDLEWRILGSRPGKLERQHHRSHRATRCDHRHPHGDAGRRLEHPGGGELVHRGLHCDRGAYRGRRRHLPTVQSVSRPPPATSFWSRRDRQRERE